MIFLSSLNEKLTMSPSQLFYYMGRSYTKALQPPVLVAQPSEDPAYSYGKYTTSQILFENATVI